MKYADWEKVHKDHGHDSVEYVLNGDKSREAIDEDEFEAELARCPICNGEPDPRSSIPVTESQMKVLQEVARAARPPQKYQGTWKSAQARAKRVLIAAGYTWSTTTGRYTPFYNAQTTTKGIRVTRVGCSDAVSISVWGCDRLDRGITRWVEASAIEVLREAGMPVDDRGWIYCAVKSY